MNDRLAQRLSQALGSSFTLEGEIGRGGMGVVYHARDERLKRKVAVKVLPPELAFREEIRIRFLREAETAARLSHPHIVPIHSVGEGPDGLVYFVMAYVDGESLAARLKRRERLPPEEARRILMETADALGAGHALGIIHRDVKPDNILLEGSRGRTVLTDFGIAKALTSTTGPGTLTATGVAIGTPHYMSPEQAAGDREIDGRSDIYSLGVVGYQMLAGELPFSAPTVPGLLLKQITEQAPNLQDKSPTCPDDLASCVMRSLEKEPEARWPTADALRRALESRSAPPYRPSRRTSGGGARGETRLGGGGGGLPPARQSGVGRPMDRRRASRAAAKKDPKSDLTASGEPKMVAKFRDAFVSWASVCGGLAVLDLILGRGINFAQWVAIPWAAFGLLPQYMKLWQTGYSWRDVLNRPVAPDAQEALLGPRRVLPAPKPDEFGRHVDTVRLARNDREAILKIMERVPTSERKLLPDVVVTVDALLKRAEHLARMLHGMSADVDDGALARIEARIEAVKHHEEGTEQERQLSLLERQRQALSDLLTRRKRVEEQIESCVLAMQNVRFDLLRLRSAGVAAVLSDLTNATQQARALSRDVDHAIAAAGEIRDFLSASPGPVSPPPRGSRPPRPQSPP
ncbi:MAG TPA: serine/threonine-protein kinase [Gemmatimonadales bacterium]|jgi:serine/threonine-protein kinase|nr:serine/threonine-protein kinase [Gemmatimonadales bacterium]